jgi:gliding motility-associatede transport system auxiliary component
MDTRPTNSSRRKFLYGSGSVASVFIVLAILVFLAFLADRYYWRWDVNADQSQSLTKVTKNIVAAVKEPLKITAFLPEGQPDRQTGKELLDNYHYQNRLITVNIVDPERQPLEAQQAGYRLPGNVLLEYQGRRQMANSPTEENITDAIRKLLNPQSKKVFFLTGHGERGDKESDKGSFFVARQALTKEGLEVQDLNLVTQVKMPEDAAAVVLAGPEKPLFPYEVKALQEYLDRGGRILLLLEPQKDGGLKEFMAAYGIVPDDRMILDDNQVSRALGASVTMPLVIQYGKHRITQDFNNVVTIFPLARPLFLAKDLPKAVHLTPIAMTTQTSYAKQGQDWLKQNKAEFNAQQDLKGPFTLAVLAQKQLPAPETKSPPEAAAKPAATPPAPQKYNGQKVNEAKNQKEAAPKAAEAAPKLDEAKKPAAPSSDAAKSETEPKTAYLAVFGDTDFADNTYFNISGNGDLFLNTVNFLVSEENQISLRAPEKKSQPLLLTGYQGWAMLLVCLILIPLAIIIAGTSAYLRRRARR